MKRECCIILILAAVAFGCANKGGKFGDIEPNNTIEEAHPVKFVEPFPVTIDPVGDQDWFKAEIKEPGYLKVQASNIPQGLALEAAFGLYQEWEGKKEKRLRNWHKLPDALPVSKEGTYYFVVGDDYNDKSSQKSFQLKVDFLKEFDFQEPNDTPQEAKPVEIGKEITLAVYPVGDQDWLKVTAPGQGYLVVYSKGVPEGIVPEVRYSGYDEWAEPKVKGIRDWRKLPDGCFIPKAGEYYILLQDQWNDGCSETPFTIKIDYLEEMDIREPNNDFKDAKEIKRGDTLRVALFPTGDVDYFKIKNAKGKKLSFLAKDVPEGIAPEMQLYKIDPNNAEKLKECGAWQKLPAQFEIEENQEYYVLLHEQWNDAGSPKTFLLKVE